MYQRIDANRFSAGVGTEGFRNRFGDRFITGGAVIGLGTRTILGTKRWVARLRAGAAGGIAHRLNGGSTSNVGITTTSSCPCGVAS